jgi:hypothetical protein
MISGAGSALGKRAREKFDIRNSLFSGGGLGSVVGTKIFGKGYSATPRARDAKSTTPALDGVASAGILNEINTNSKITAKNTMSIPMMARDMNLVRLNIVKVAKALGAKPNRDKADMYWSNSKRV